MATGGSVSSEPEFESLGECDTGQNGTQLEIGRGHSCPCLSEETHTPGGRFYLSWGIRVICSGPLIPEKDNSENQ